VPGYPGTLCLGDRGTLCLGDRGTLCLGDRGGLFLGGSADEAVSVPLPEAVKRPDGARWAAWLERHRVELNEMPTPQFVAWLDSEMANHEGGKVIPPEEVAVDRYKAALEAAVRERETERILEEAGIDDVVDETLRGLEIPDGADLLQDVSDHFKVAPQELWAARVNSLAREAASP
jgi:hypothetical protein